MRLLWGRRPATSVTQLLPALRESPRVLNGQRASLPPRLCLSCSTLTIRETRERPPGSMPCPTRHGGGLVGVTSTRWPWQVWASTVGWPEASITHARGEEARARIPRWSFDPSGGWLRESLSSTVDGA